MCLLGQYCALEYARRPQFRAITLLTAYVLSYSNRFPGHFVLLFSMLQQGFGVSGGDANAMAQVIAHRYV